MQNSALTSSDYPPSHSWHYVLGGSVRTPKQILKDVKTSNFQSYKKAEFDQASKLAEPERSAKLRQLTDHVKGELQRDLSCYREVALRLRRDRLRDHGKSAVAVCSDLNVSVSLKHNHIYNNFAHPIYLESLDKGQKELFDF